MPRTIRFHLDEHVHPGVAAGLRRLGADVTTTADVALLGATDPTQAGYAATTGRVLFTQDDDFLSYAATGADHPGIAYCRQNSRSIGDIIRGLELIWEIYETDEMR